MLNFGRPQVTAHYFVLVLISFVGVLQIVVARYRLKNLSLVSPSRQPWPGLLLGSVLVAGAFVWFVAATPEMLLPGSAGLEISFLFATAALLDLVYDCFIGLGERLFMT
jgi:hypothetical protein